MRRALLLLSMMAAALVVASGVALAVTKQCKTYVLADPEQNICYGTKERDTLRGDDTTNFMVGKRSSDTLKGFGSLDYLVGGPARDALSGGSHEDRYFFEEGWGKDSITDDEASANELLFRKAGPGAEFITEDLMIDLISGPGPEVTNDSGTGTLNWEGNVIYGVSSGEGDDHITGNSLGNNIFGNDGADTIFGREGNDEIEV